MATTKNTPALSDDLTPAPRAPQTVDMLDSEVFQRFLAASEGAGDELDADQVTLDIIGRILHATTVDDVLGGRAATHARDMLGVPFMLTGVRFNRSDFDGAGPSFYALLEGADRNGERVTVTCGARNVIAQAWKLNDIGALPIAVQLAESDRPTRAGYKVMWLDAVPSGF
jgi:hypothetical protein